MIQCIEFSKQAYVFGLGGVVAAMSLELWLFIVRSEKDDMIVQQQRKRGVPIHHHQPITLSIPPSCLTSRDEKAVSSDKGEKTKGNVKSKR